MDWKNRIVSYGEISPEDAMENPLNYRKHPTAQKRVLTAMLKEVGYVQPIMINQRTGRIVDGHLRVELAKEQNVKTLPVIYIDVDLIEERKLLSTIDPVAAMATIDQEVLNDLLLNISSESQLVNDLWDSMRREITKEKEQVDWEKGSERYAFTESATERYLTNSVRTITIYIQAEEYTTLLPKMDALVASLELKSYQELILYLIRREVEDE